MVYSSLIFLVSLIHVPASPTLAPLSHLHHQGQRSEKEWLGGRLEKSYQEVITLLTIPSPLPLMVSGRG